jgi:hypothetical protein
MQEEDCGGCQRVQHAFQSARINRPGIASLPIIALIDFPCSSRRAAREFPNDKIPTFAVRK